MARHQAVKKLAKEILMFPIKQYSVQQLMLTLLSIPTVLELLY